MKRALLLVLLMGVAFTAHAQTKKLLRIHTAGPNDTNVDNTMLAVEFQDRVNADADTRRGQGVPGEPARPDARGDRGDAPGLGRRRHHRRPGGIRLVRASASACSACRSSGRATTTRSRCSTARSARSSTRTWRRPASRCSAWAVSWGYRNVVTAKKEVKKAADLKGLKIRTIPTKVFVAAINSMGANATPMNFGEIYTSLQSGVLDGYEHTAATTISFKINEVACCIALTRHLMDPTFLVFSLAEWKKLSAGRAGGAAEGARTRPREMVRKMAPQREGEALAEVKKLGMKVNEIDTRAAAEGRAQGAGRAGEGVRRREAARADPQDSSSSREAALFACDRPRRRVRRRGDLRGDVRGRPAAGLQPLRPELLADLERGVPDLLPHLDRVPRHPDRLPARRAPLVESLRNLLPREGRRGVRPADRAASGLRSPCRWRGSRWRVSEVAKLQSSPGLEMPMS